MPSKIDGIVNFIKNHGYSSLDPEIKAQLHNLILANPAPLCIAVQTGELALVELLIQVNSNYINAYDENGVTPLHYAVDAKQYDLTKLLLEKGAYPNVFANGYTPLHHAVAADQCDLVKLLVANDADPHMYNQFESGQAKLYRAFGGEKIAQVIENDFEGGIPRLVISDLVRRLQEFNKTQDNQYVVKHAVIVHTLEAIHNISDNNLDANIKNMPLDTYVLFNARIKRHFMPVIFNKTADGKILLSLIDRGYFHDVIASNAYNQQDASGPCIATIEIPKLHLDDVISLLKHASGKEVQEAGKIYFEEIPQLMGKSYQLDPASKQKSLKKDLCFYGNMKSVIHFLATQLLSNEAGIEYYKDFTLFEREQELSDFQRLATAEQQGTTQKTIEAAVKILQQKRIKLFEKHGFLAQKPQETSAQNTDSANNADIPLNIPVANH